MTSRRKLRVGGGRVAMVIAAVAGLTVTGATGALAGPGGAPGQSGGPGQWSMAGQNIDDTHFQAAEHAISPANAGRLGLAYAPGIGAEARRVGAVVWFWAVPNCSALPA